ncbi:hypothetical protein BD410DRAFT_287397 [Rickenella mellea]|uniref:G-protein coupled receptors family 1 profile domain-containing protein n=1 Tax=Rickenella mellea TaxID=50990 RepID=A0A4Y7Q216_9AGAM|nr:hypothetical protein BD410DRAFT_287397 [Rickenella mellea]
MALQSCRGFFYPWLIFSVLTDVGLTSIFTLRTYAVYQKSKVILAFLGTMALAVCSISLYTDGILLTPAANDSPTLIACGYNTGDNFTRFELASLSITLVFDMFVFILTFAKTIRHILVMRKVGMKNGLGYIILRDGTLYFFAKVLISIAEISVFCFPSFENTWGTLIPNFGNVVVITVVTRLVLNLRQVARTEASLTTIDTLHVEPEFATNSVLGNLGAPLRVAYGEDTYGAEEIPLDDHFVERSSSRRRPPQEVEL